MNGAKIIWIIYTFYSFIHYTAYFFNFKLSWALSFAYFLPLACICMLLKYFIYILCVISSCCKWTIIWLSLLCVQIFVWWVMYDIKFTNKLYRYHYPVHKWKIMNLQWTSNMKNAMLPKHTKWYMQETFLHARLWDMLQND